MILILPVCSPGWLLIRDFYNLTSFGSVGFKFILAIYIRLFFIYPLSWFHVSVSSPTQPHSYSQSFPQKAEIWLVKIWQVILLLSLPECFELSLCIAKWHPSLHASPPHHIITSRAPIHQSYLCINEWKPKGRKFAFSRRDLKVLVAFAQGHVPLQPPDHLWCFFFFLFAKDELHN